MPSPVSTSLDSFLCFYFLSSFIRSRTSDRLSTSDQFLMYFMRKKCAPISVFLFYFSAHVQKSLTWCAHLLKSETSVADLSFILLSKSRWLVEYGRIRKKKKKNRTKKLWFVQNRNSSVPMLQPFTLDCRSCHNVYFWLTSALSHKINDCTQCLNRNRKTKTSQRTKNSNRPQK